MPEWQDKILLCRRAIEPRLGFWTVPAGFMENGETMQAAAARECQEEALAEVEVGSLLAVVNVTRRGPSARDVSGETAASPKFAPGPESLEVALVRRGGDPVDANWRLPAANIALRQYFADRTAGREDHHFTELKSRPPLKS